jgi:hypothetical protein
MQRNRKYKNVMHTVLWKTTLASPVHQNKSGFKMDYVTITAHEEKMFQIYRHTQTVK